MSPTMLCDAIKHSTGAQLRALYDYVRVSVSIAPHRWGCVQVTAYVRHRNRDYGYSEDFPTEMFQRDGSFYDEYVRERFPRQVARSVNDMIMADAL